MIVENKSQSASRETAYWLENKGGSTPASTTLHPQFVPLIKPGKQFLDVGCGYGRISRQLADLGARVVAIDPNYLELLIGRKKFPDIVFIQAYGEQLPFPTDIFDRAVALGVLGAVNKQERKKILEETISSLKIGGLLYIAEFARITNPMQRTHHGNQRWIDVYEKDQSLTGEYGSVVVHSKSSWDTSFIAHHFTHNELDYSLRDVGIQTMAIEEMDVRSSVSGQIRNTLNGWGVKL